MDWTALGLSLQLAALTTLILCGAGLPLAYWLAVTKWRWKFLLEAVVALPLVLPPTVLGFYILIAIGPHSPLGPCALGLLIHVILEHGLHETMYTQHVCASIAPHQGVPAQHPQGFVELVQIESCGSKGRPQFGGTARKQLFRDGIRSQERTEAQQIGCGGTLLLDSLK